MAASTEGVLSSTSHELVMGMPTTKRARTRSPTSMLRSLSSSRERLPSPQPCVDVICCDADHSLPVACADECCTASAPSSPCSDIHHISSACTEPTCGAASSSTSSNIICSTAIACCDDTACVDAPPQPCSQTACATAPSECSSMTLAVPTIATCCTDEACEPDASKACDAVPVAPSADPHLHKDRHATKSHNECRECRGSITSLGTAEGGKLYSSFQELLDCCCCSMPPTVEQCCVGQTPYPCNTPHPSPADMVSPAVHGQHHHAPPPSDTPSSSIITNATQHTSPGRDHSGSRASTASTAATPQPVSASPSLASLQWPSVYLPAPSPHDKTKYTSSGLATQPAVSFEDIFTELQSWNDCSFEQPHLHSSHGGCLPPAMTLCNSDLCQTTAPHSHWMPHTQQSSQQQDARPQQCQWGGCNERFWTVEELVAHVNHSHLARKNGIATDSQQTTTVDALALQPSAQGTAHTAEQSAASLECLWKDCHQVPMPEKLDFGTFTPTTEDDVWKAAGGVHANANGNNSNDKFSLAILQHLLHDHLGQHSAPSFSLKGENPADPLALSSHQHDHAAVQKLPSSPAVSSINTSAAWSKKRKYSAASSSIGSSGTGAFDDMQLCCRWEGCSASFTSHSSLTDHIETEHVGSGKATYECRWLGCPRHASGALFSQKQKVLRHIQTHTGDRPFKCTVCSKRFSEANTLAQHMRTHTQERPYVCDYPGCGKAFSVAGSLTIHKRTHTGSKPFVCGYPGCGKAFAESSNLTKHTRTHTGDKPFKCEECGKSFSRPDQAARHRKTHERKRARGKREGMEASAEEEVAAA